MFFAFAALGFGVFLHRTIFGRRIFEMEANLDATRYSGVDVARYRVVVFAVTGFMRGLAAILLSSRLGSVRLSIATGWELQVIMMVVLGGVGIVGGTGTIFVVVLSVSV